MPKVGKNLFLAGLMFLQSGCSVSDLKNIDNGVTGPAYEVAFSEGQGHINVRYGDVVIFSNGSAMLVNGVLYPLNPADTVYISNTLKKEESSLEEKMHRMIILFGDEVRFSASSIEGDKFNNPTGDPAPDKHHNFLPGQEFKESAFPWDSLDYIILREENSKTNESSWVIYTKPIP